MAFIIKNEILEKYIPEENETDVVIPKGVKTISHYTFRNCKSLKSITFCEGVKKIEQCAFVDCDSLETVTFPESITSIGREAFWRCRNLQSVVIPKSVKIIPYEAFSNCTNLKSVTISEGVKSIGQSAFAYCVSLETVSFPKSVKTIRERAFSDCKNLKSANISKGVDNIKISAFSLCEKLECINVDRENQSYTDADGVLFDKNMTKLIKYPNGKKTENYVIPDGVKIIGSHAFEYCPYLKSVTIPESVEEIENFAFEERTKLIFSHSGVEISFVLRNRWNDKITERRLSEFFHNPIFDNFSSIKTTAYKYPIVMLMFFGYGKEEYKDYIKKNIIRITYWIINIENYKFLDFILSADFITQRNIDKIIQYAVNAKKTEMFVILNSFKTENNWCVEDNFDL